MATPPLPNSSYLERSVGYMLTLERTMQCQSRSFFLPRVVATKLWMMDKDKLAIRATHPTTHPISSGISQTKTCTWTDTHQAIRTLTNRSTTAPSNTHQKRVNIDLTFIFNKQHSMSVFTPSRQHDDRQIRYGRSQIVVFDRGGF